MTPAEQVRVDYLFEIASKKNPRSPPEKNTRKRTVETWRAEEAQLVLERDQILANQAERIEKIRQRLHHVRSRIRREEAVPTESLPMKTPERFRLASMERNRQTRAGFYPGLTERLRREQDGKCAICKVKMNIENKKAMTGEQADHDHETGKARGLLCRACNSSLGFYEKHQRQTGLVMPPYETYLRARGGV